MSVKIQSLLNGTWFHAEFFRQNFETFPPLPAFSCSIKKTLSAKKVPKFSLFDFRSNIHKDFSAEFNLIGLKAPKHNSMV